LYHLACEHLEAYNVAQLPYQLYITLLCAFGFSSLLTRSRKAGAVMHICGRAAAHAAVVDSTGSHAATFSTSRQPTDGVEKIHRFSARLVEPGLPVSIPCINCCWQVICGDQIGGHRDYAGCAGRNRMDRTCSHRDKHTFDRVPCLVNVLKLLVTKDASLIRRQ
jgi:hypothetical protein